MPSGGYPLPWNVAVGVRVVTVVLPSWLVPVTLACLSRKWAMSMELEDLNDSFSVIIQPEPWFACLYNEITTTFSAIRRSGTVSTCTPSEWSHQCYGFWYDLADAGRPSLKSGAAFCVKAGWERSTGRMSSNWNTCSGAFTATEHSPPVPTWPQGSSFLSPLCRVLLFLLWSKGHYLPGAGTAGTSTLYFEAGSLYGTGDPLSQPPQCWEYRWVPSS